MYRIMELTIIARKCCRLLQAGYPRASYVYGSQKCKGKAILMSTMPVTKQIHA